MPGKSLGSPANDDEQALEHAIRRVAAWADTIVSYRPVGGGITNTNWRVDAGADSFFVKIPGRGTEMFIDRAVALDASSKAQVLGIGPPVHTWLANDGIEIATFVTDRRPCGLGDFQNERVCRSVIDSYRTLHAAAPLPLTKTVFDMIREHLRQVKDLKGWHPQDVSRLHQQVERAQIAIFASGLDLVPCFNDPMPGNFLVGEDKSVMLIDFEYASNNDRAYDLGAWFGEMFFPSEKEAMLAEHYMGRHDAAILARTTVYKALADLKWATWSMVQEKISNTNFDYRKYGLWKYMRARTIILDPNWDTWLREL